MSFTGRLTASLGQASDMSQCGQHRPLLPALAPCKMHSFACCVLMGTELCIRCAARLSAIRSSFHRIGPDRLITPELISDKHCVLRQTHINQKTPSRAAESVAAVAMNSFGVSEICSSP